MDLVEFGDVMASEPCSEIKRDKFRSNWCLGYDFFIIIAEDCLLLAASCGHCMLRGSLWLLLGLDCFVTYLLIDSSFSCDK